jgi:eukaryotic-like serine/threonine-protein kinase
MIEYSSGDVLPSDPRERLAQSDHISEDELVNLLCADQVKRWRAGERIPAEAYLALHPTLTAGNEGAFELVYGEYLVRELMGEPPKLDEFLWRFPRFAERLERQLSLHHALLTGEAGDEPDVPLEAQGPDDVASSTAPEVPGFDVKGELGRGGMSVVYLARQVALNRLVALKVIRARVYADAMIAARFRDEALAAARFQHPNIVQVYEVGEFDGQGYLVLEYAAGGSLEQKLANTPQPARESAQLIEDLARALHYAHQHGIVHRDLKPANVVLTETGLPKVTDFGLAKLMEREGGLTQTGDIMGTPSYMAPEQAQGTPSDATPATDVYALGAILYEMLTGRPPFKGATPLSTLSQVTGHEPVAPSKLQRHTPRELETICLKCLEKEPRKRYATALDLADDLRRFLENRPIKARRISFAEWCWRWCRREPVKAGLLVALVCAFAAGVAGVAVQWRRAEEKAAAETLARTRAEQEQRRALNSVYFSRIAQARLEWRLNNAAGARQLLERCDTQRRGWEWHYLSNLSQSELLSINPPNLSYVLSAMFSPDGKHIAFTGYDPYQIGHEGRASPVEVWDTAAQQPVQSFDGPVHAFRLSFSPDGRSLAASGPRETKIWNLSTGQQTRVWSPGGSVTFSPDGRYLASCNDSGISFWDAATGATVRRFSTPGGRVTFSPDGQVLAVSAADAVKLYDQKTGREIRSLPHGNGEEEARRERSFPEEGPDLAFSADGKMLVVATLPPRVWDLATGQLLHQLSGHAGPVPGVAFGPDGRQVATVGVDSTIRIWDAETGAERTVLRGHTAMVGCIAFHPDGWSLLSGGRHVAEVKVWDLTRQQDAFTLPRAAPNGFVFDNDGTHLKLVTNLGRLETREITSGVTEFGSLIEVNRHWITPAATAEWSADGRWVATTSADRQLVKVWDSSSENAPLTFKGLTAPATYLSVSPDGARIAAAGLYVKNEVRRRDVKVWDRASQQILAAFTPALGPTRFTHGRVAISPDGQRVAFDDYDPAPGEAAGSAPAIASMRLKVCDVASGRERLSLSCGSSVLYCLTFSADGKVLAAATFDGELFVWNAETGELLHNRQLSGYFFRLAFSPDGRRLAGINRELVQIWNVPEYDEVLLLRGARPRSLDGGFNPAMAWSPDGRKLASMNWDGSISVWNASEQTITEADRLKQAESRAFVWHLTEAEAAASRHQAAAAGFHLSKLAQADPPDLSSLARRARLHLQLGHFKQAVGDFARWKSRGGPDDSEAYVSYARLLILEGNTVSYQSFCNQMLLTLEKSPHPQTAYSAAAVIGLGCGSPVTAARVVKLARRELLVARTQAGEAFALALADFRAQEYERASAALRNLIDQDIEWAWRSWPILAMIEHRLGHREQARQALDRALEWLDQHQLELSASPPTRVVPESWLDVQAQCQEALALSNQAK